MSLAILGGIGGALGGAGVFGTGVAGALGGSALAGGLTGLGAGATIGGTFGLGQGGNSALSMLNAGGGGGGGGIPGISNIGGLLGGDTSVGNIVGAIDPVLGLLGGSLGLFGGDDDDQDLDDFFKDLRALSPAATGAANILTEIFGDSIQANEGNVSRAADFIFNREPLSFTERAFDRQLRPLFMETFGIRDAIESEVAGLTPELRNRFFEGFIPLDVDITPYREEALRNLTRRTEPGLMHELFAQGDSEAGRGQILNASRDVGLALGTLEANLEEERLLRNSALKAQTQQELLGNLLTLPSIGHEFQVGAQSRLADFGEQGRIRRESVRSGAAPPVKSIFDAGGIFDTLSRIEATQQFLAPTPQFTGGSGLPAGFGQLFGNQGFQSTIERLLGGGTSTPPFNPSFGTGFGTGGSIFGTYGQGGVTDMILASPGTAIGSTGGNPSGLEFPGQFGRDLRLTQIF